MFVRTGPFDRDSKGPYHIGIRTDGYKMSCCIPGCTAKTLLVRFPEHASLRKRWFRVIELATGVTLARSKPGNDPLRICLAHFATPDERFYQEPSIFLKKKGNEEVRISISDCKLCHRFVPTSGMGRLNGMVNGAVLASILFQTIRVRVRPRDYAGFVCRRCLVKVDLVRSIQTEFAAHKTTGDLMDGWKKPLEVEAVVSDGGEGAQEESVQVEYLEEWDQAENQQVAWEPVREENVSSDEWELPEQPEKPLKRSYIKRRAPGFKTVVRKKVVNQGIASAMKCYICPVQFQSREELMSHQVENHKDPAEYSCKECGGERFETVTKFNSHLRHHDATERPYQCKFCSMRYCTRKSLREHVSRHHEGNRPRTRERPRRNHQCETCGKIVHSIGALRKHLVAQHEDHQFQCPTCQKVLSSEQDLLKHRLWHLNELPFRCQLCQTKFRNRCTLNLHMASVHNGPDPFRCRRCQLTFRSQFRYRNHMHQMHGRRADYHKVRNQFRCPLCPEVPRRKKDLEEHVAVCHAGEQYPWRECPLCPGLRLVNGVALTVHTRAKHREKVAKQV